MNATPFPNAPNVRVEHIGNEGEPVLVIERALGNAASLKAEAEKAVWDVTSPFYPGIRAAAPADYAAGLAQGLAPLTAQIFGPAASRLTPVETSFSLVTTPPEQLVAYQRVPHFDGADPGTLAVLHYLTDEPRTGTAFFRHRSTGYETITEDRLAAYQKTTDAELLEDGEPPRAYINGSTSRFEQIARFGCVYNRILIYRGCTLHSGCIPEDFTFDSDPRKGRLTANTFLQFAA